MKPLFIASTLLLALTACEAHDRVANPNAAQKCHEQMGLAVGSTEYNDCYAKMSIVEDDVKHRSDLPK